MKLTAAIMTLLVSCFVSVYAQDTVCECINPFSGTSRAYRGNPDTLCDTNQGPGFCYVACDGACRDQMDTASVGR